MSSNLGTGAGHRDKARFASNRDIERGNHAIDTDGQGRGYRGNQVMATEAFVTAAVCNGVPEAALAASMISETAAEAEMFP